MARLTIAIFIFVLIIPTQIVQARSLDIAGWIPWWQDTLGIESATDNIRDLDIVYPFAFEVAADGTLIAKADLNEKKWRRFIRLAKKRRVDVIPTVMWFDGNEMQGVLSDRKKRDRHIAEIVAMVKDGGFDGVNIDYEGKKAETIDYFSHFLKDLENELGRKDLTCTIEARTPPESLYREVPDVIQYANDYKAMNKYCDWVEIMAYDQQRADLLLNSKRSGEPYIPVADIDWVEKVITFALEAIDADKILLGVPTYGRQWELTVEPNWYKSYSNISALNLPDALELADDVDVQPGRNKAGEASYTFFPDSSVFKVLDVLPVPVNTRKGFEAAAKALLFANMSGMTVPVRVVWYSDAEAIEEKILLAKKYKLKGVALFKIDGEEDEDIWDLF